MDRVNDLAHRGIAWQTRPGSEPGKQQPIHLPQATEIHCGDAVSAKIVTTSGEAIPFPKLAAHAIATPAQAFFTSIGGSADVTWIRICFGFVSSRFGSSTVRMPFENAAVILSLSTVVGSEKLRLNLP